MKEIKTRRIYLDDYEVSKVIEFFEKEFGITDIAQIGIDDECALITTVTDENSELEKSIKAFKDFSEAYMERLRANENA